MRGRRTVLKALLIMVVSGIFCISTMAFASPGEVEVSCGRQGWYFAEGYTGGDFDTWILIQNPNEEPATVHMRFLTPTGEPVTHDYVIAGQSRHTVYLNSVPGIEGLEVSTEVICEDQGVIAERAMYFSYEGDGGERAGGHASIGATNPSYCWYLPEGYTGGGFDTYILLMNPNEEDVIDAELKLLKPQDGRYYPFKVDIPAGKRVTVKVDDLVYVEGAENKIATGEGGGEEEQPLEVRFDNTDVSTVVHSSKPIVAERAMYFDYYGRAGGSASIGAPSAAPEWYLPEGYTGAAFDTWVMAMNPNWHEVDITYTFYSNQPGFEPVSVTHANVPPWSRDTIHVDDVPGLEGTDVSTRVTATRAVELQAAGEGPEKYAVLYGVEQYGGASDPQYAVDDMYDIKHRLVDYCGFDYSNMRYRADDQATVEKFQEDMQWLSEVAGSDDLVFFFAGKSHAAGANNYIDLYDGPISDDQLAGYFDALQTQKLVGLLSADDSGEFLVTLGGEGRVLMASCAKGETDHEFTEDAFKAASGDSGNGAFAYYFVEGLTRKAADSNGDDRISAEEAFNYLKPKVTALVNDQAGESQVPQISDNIAGDVNLTVERVPANIVAERSMYFHYEASTDGHTSIGTPCAYRNWYLAEGYTGGGFDTYVLVVNPLDVPQQVDARFMTAGGDVVEKTYLVPPKYRLTIKVDDVDPVLAATDVSTSITAKAVETGEASAACGENVGVAVERAMYFTYTDPYSGEVVRGGSCSIGYGTW